MSTGRLGRRTAPPREKPRRGGAGAPPLLHEVVLLEAIPQGVGRALDARYSTARLSFGSASAVSNALRLRRADPQSHEGQP